jgi:hypothetical protein
MERSCPLLENQKNHVNKNRVIISLFRGARKSKIPIHTSDRSVDRIGTGLMVILATEN